MSSSPWEWLWNGDEDVATPFHVGAVSRRAQGTGCTETGLHAMAFPCGVGANTVPLQ
jgi:hypothetical protein